MPVSAPPNKARPAGGGCNQGTYDCSGNCTASYRACSTPTPSCTLSVSPTSTYPGRTVTLSWTSRNASSRSIQGIGSVSASGSTGTVASSSLGTSTYKMTVQGHGTTRSCSVQLLVEPNPATCTLSVSPEVAQPGDQVTLSWTTSYASSVSLSTVGSVTASGSRAVTVPNGLGTTSYSLTAADKLCTVDVLVRICFYKYGKLCSSTNQCGAKEYGSYDCSGDCTAPVATNTCSLSPVNYCGQGGTPCPPSDLVCAKCTNPNSCGLSYRNGRELQDGSCGDHPANRVLAKPPESTCFVAPGEIPSTTLLCTKVTGCLQPVTLDIRPKLAKVGGTATLSYDLGSNPTTSCLLTGPGLEGHTLQARDTLDLTIDRPGQWFYSLTCIDPIGLASGTLSASLRTAPVWGEG